MSIFYDKKKKTIDIYTLKINTNSSSNGLVIKSNGIVTITFINRIFDSCDFPFSGMYSRHEWEILSEIRKEIAEIESFYRAKHGIL